MKSSVQVLMTLIHLSFSRMLITDIEVFSFSTIITEEREYLVWFADGNVQVGKTIGHRVLLGFATLVRCSLSGLPLLVARYIGPQMKCQFQHKHQKHFQKTHSKV